MNRRLATVSVILALAGLLCVQGCDFPDDPPLKPIVPPVVTEPSRIDSAQSLLELKRGISWVYMAVPRGEQPQTYVLNPSDVTIAGTRYFRAPFGYTPDAPSRFGVTMPLLLRQVDRSIAFYEFPLDTLREPGRSPRYAFILPYPAQVGSRTAETNGPTGNVSVLVAAKDTVIEDHTGAMRRVYRYDVTGYRNGKLVIYALPGKALLRIDQDDVTYHTLTWIGL
ncbi:MAG: hypothetical protein HY962_03180 [Ignavibacteriae bacterium]|nr:hypothetical protein [Ignavibacteriota bacterium]